MEKEVFVLFGREAVRKLENWDIAFLTAAIMSGSIPTYDVHKFSREDFNPLEIIDVALGWDDYAPITEEEYNRIVSARLVVNKKQRRDERRNKRG